MGGFQAPLSGHIEAALSKYAVGYRSPQFIADLVVPRVGVPNQTDKYFIFDRRKAQLTQQTARAPGAGATQVRRTLSTTTFKCDDHALAALIPDEEREGYDLGDLQQEATRHCLELLQLDREKALADMVSDTSIITQYSTLSGSDQWSDPTNSDPLDDVMTAKTTVLKAAGVLPNVMLISPPVLDALQKHETIKDSFKYTTPGAIGIPQLQSYFQIDRVLLCAAVYQDKGGTNDFVLGKHAILAYANPAASREDPSFAKTFVWEGAPNSRNGYKVEIGRMSPPSSDADEVSVHWYYDQAVTFASAAYLIASASA